MFARVFAFLSLFATCISAEESYSIQMARPLKAGGQFDVSVKMALDDSIATSLNGREVEDNRTVAACRLTGRLSVVAVTAKGQPKELKLKIKTVECVSDDREAQFFKADDELHLRHAEPQNVVEVNGEPAEELQAQAIEAILNVQSDGEGTDDDVFGTTEKVKVGAEWPVNTKAAVADLEREGLAGLKPENIKGSARLVRTTTVGDQPALLVRMDSRIDGKDIGLSSLPESVKTTRFHAEVTGEMDLPVDLNSNNGRSKGLSVLEVDATGRIDQDGVETKIDVKIRRRVATELTAAAVK
jgi:hypothetical protein